MVTARKRRHGEGSIRRIERRDKNGDPLVYYEARLTVDGRSRSYSAKTEKEVRRKLDIAREAARKGQAIPAIKKLTVGQVVTEWLDLYVNEASGIRPSTAESYRQYARNHILNAEIAGRRASQLTRDEVKAFLLGKSKAGLKPQTVKHIFTVLSRALRSNDETRHVVTFRPKDLSLPKIERPEVEGIDAEDAAAILQAFDGHELDAFVALTLLCGLRKGEALGLTWADVDFQGGRISIRRQWDRLAKGEYRAVPLKTARSRRTIDAPALVLSKLQAQRARIADLEARYPGPAWRRYDVVFPSVRRRGEPTNPATVNHLFWKQLAAAGLQRMRVHDLRHDAASLMLAQGLSLREIMEQLGHSQIGITANLYTHVAPEMRSRPARAMDALFGSG